MDIALPEISFILIVTYKYEYQTSVKYEMSYPFWVCDMSSVLEMRYFCLPLANRKLDICQYQLELYS